MQVELDLINLEWEVNNGGTERAISDFRRYTVLSLRKPLC